MEWACQLSRTEAFDVLEEDVLDSKALIAWGPEAVVLAFRGTASLKNAGTDIRVRIASDTFLWVGQPHKPAEQQTSVGGANISQVLHVPIALNFWAKHPCKTSALNLSAQSWGLCSQSLKKDTEFSIVLNRPSLQLRCTWHAQANFAL